MRKEMTNAKVTTFNNFQLVFFPAVLTDHYYLLHFNFMEGTLDVIDNMILSPNVSVEDKYGDDFTKMHMETYEGQCQKQWNSGLEKDNFEQMKRLRVEYCGNIITSEVNEERKKVLKMARKWSKINKF
ncbi:uncharacterized protein LOC110703595 [Chenopodium quinoa]|uniref:uncharacterized protein LOC110703595 n=1 Tax=Chenopodium quinoa TaxID=63459 RepID=UPI000B79AF06|nr:uncharacterized protein LOC110703595 [Chenopodium quinoa]